MNKRPKSREETPKEGSDSARRYRTATICDRAAQKARAFESFPVQNSPRPAIGRKFNAGVFFVLFQMLEDRPSIDRRSSRDVIHQALEFVIDDVVKKCTVSQADSNAEIMGSDADRIRYPCATCRIGLGRNGLFSPRSEPKEQP